ncbi:MAG: FMN-binding negative transcriptional regulator [Myxococcota bacterium]
MHPNPLFRSRDPDANLRFAQDRGFGVLTVNGEASPHVAHVPLLLNDTNTEVWAHLSRANPLLGALPKNGCLVVSGPDAYISPDWYGLRSQVPTWNYVAVHLRGHVQIAGPDTLREHLDTLAAAHEAQFPSKAPWRTTSVPPEKLEAMMRAIVPVRLSLQSVEGTWKLGQNKPRSAVHAAAETLMDSDYGQEVATLADWMRKEPDR